MFGWTGKSLWRTWSGSGFCIFVKVEYGLDAEKKWHGLATPMAKIVTEYKKIWRFWYNGQKINNNIQIGGGGGGQN